MHRIPRIFWHNSNYRNIDPAFGLMFHTRPDLGDYWLEWSFWRWYGKVGLITKAEDISGGT